jgi:hypothetical protein
MLGCRGELEVRSLMPKVLKESRGQFVPLSEESMYLKDRAW